MSFQASRLAGPALADGMMGIPLTLAEQEAVEKMMDKELMPILDKIVAECQKKAEHQRIIAEADRDIVQLDKEILTSQQRIDEAQQKITKAQKIIGTNEKRNREIIVSVFLRIFGIKQDLKTEHVEAFFTKYLSDKAIGKGDGHFKLDSMKGVILYLSEHPDLVKCDFRMFNEQVSDIQTLSDYLAKAECKVTAIAFNKAIGDEDKAILRSAAQARKGSLKVFCQ